MLYLTLLTKIAKFVQDNPADPGTQTVVELSKQMGVEPTVAIMAYDIKEIESLRRIIPAAFPKVIRQGPLCGNQNIHGAWRVEPMVKALNNKKHLATSILL